MSTPRAIIFDIDETLSPDISWLSLTTGLGASAEDELAIYESYKTGKTDYQTAKDQLLTLWRATDNAKYDYFHEQFSNLPLNPDAPAVIAALQPHYDICLITGSMDLYAQIIAEKLGVETWFANTTLYWEGSYLVDMDYELDQAAKKLEQFMSYCTDKGYKPEECVIVGDGDNEIPLFDATKRGVLVRVDPPGELREHAWKVIDKLRDLPDILDQTK